MRHRNAKRFLDGREVRAEEENTRSPGRHPVGAPERGDGQEAMFEKIVAENVLGQDKNQIQEATFVQSKIRKTRHVVKKNLQRAKLSRMESA